MAKTEWYRKVSWTPVDREDFFAHLSRTRSSYNKAQRLRIQAWHLLADAKPPNYQGALELLDLLLSDSPDANEIGAALLQRAKCLEALGRIEDAGRDYRHALKADVNHAGIHTTDATFHFAMFAVRRHRKDLYQDVLDSLHGAEMAALVSQNRYRLCAAMAIIAADQGKKEDAREYAAKALELFEQLRASASTEDQEILKDLVNLTAAANQPLQRTGPAKVLSLARKLLTRGPGR